jgi:hypothetical protein
METNVTLPTPKSVKRAVNLLWVSAALGAVALVAVALDLFSLPGESISQDADTLTYLFTCSFLALAAIKLTKRRNWARWLLAVVVSLGLVSGALSMLLLPAVSRSASTAFFGFDLVQSALQLVALVLVFVPDSAKWFSHRHAVV